jgi:hypothetical protein
MRKPTLGNDRKPEGDQTPEEVRIRKVFMDEGAAGLLRDLGDKGNPDLGAFGKNLDELTGDELLWLALQRVRERGQQG